MFPDASRETWIPPVHADMTRSSFSSFVAERVIMNHFVKASLKPKDLLKQFDRLAKIDVFVWPFHKPFVSFRYRL
jgi:hypothetical protein